MCFRHRLCCSAQAEQGVPRSKVVTLEPWGLPRQSAQLTREGHVQLAEVTHGPPSAVRHSEVRTYHPP